jgi:hypothetical protein
MEPAAGAEDAGLLSKEKPQPPVTSQLPQKRYPRLADARPIGALGSGVPRLPSAPLKQLPAARPPWPPPDVITEVGALTRLNPPRPPPLPELPPLPACPTVTATVSPAEPELERKLVPTTETNTKLLARRAPLQLRTCLSAADLLKKAMPCFGWSQGS